LQISVSTKFAGFAIGKEEKFKLNSILVKVDENPGIKLKKDLPYGKF